MGIWEYMGFDVILKFVSSSTALTSVQLASSSSGVKLTHFRFEGFLHQVQKTLRETFSGGLSDQPFMASFVEIQYESIGMIIPNIWENKMDVPDHQPVIHAEVLCSLAFSIYHLEKSTGQP